MLEEKLEKEIEIYKDLAKSDKKIDVASLMINALTQQETNLLSEKQKKWAYLISLVVPPFGLIFAVKFYASGKDDGKTSALVCVVLTVVSILLAVLFVQVIFSGSGVDVNQIKQIKPSDIQQLYQ